MIKGCTWHLINFLTLAIFTGSSWLLLTGLPANISNVEVLLGATILTLAFYAVSLWSREKSEFSDPYLLPIVGMLSIIGLIFLFRLNPSLAIRQYFWILLGLGAMLIMFLYGYEKLARYKYLYIILGLIFMFITSVKGVEVGGAKIWLEIGGFRFQPAEIVKILVVLFLAFYLEDNRELLKEGVQWGKINVPAPQALGPLLLFISLSLVILVFQRDLGTALIFYLTFLIMFYMASGRLDYTGIGALLFAVGAVASYFIFPHVQSRVAIWLHPWIHFDGKGYQIIQGLFAMGSGGLFGTGLGMGRPDLIPEVETDYIFAAVAEELGLYGSVAIMMLYLVLIYRGFKIALAAKDNPGQLLAGGISSLLAVQTLVIVGGVTKLLPLTGITLPFMSYGGSSLIVNYILIGLLWSVSRVKVK